MEYHERRNGELAGELVKRATGPADHFDDLVGRASSERSTGERQTRRWQHQLGEESATWHGTLLDLAERAATVTLDTTRGVRVVGRMTGVGTDVVVVARENAADLWIRLDRISAVSLLERLQWADGSRPVQSVTFQSLLFNAAGFRPAVSLVLSGLSTTVNGVLMSCGVDVCVVRTDGEVRRSVVVRLDSVEEATVHG